VIKKTGGGNNLGTRQRPGNTVGTRLAQIHNTNSSAADYNYFQDFLIGRSPSSVVWCFWAFWAELEILLGLLSFATFGASLCTRQRQ